MLFPIFDVRGEPVAFGGRILPGAEGPKYKNSPETPLYSKSRMLYGLNWAKADVVEAGEVVVCEGYTDVIGFCHGRACPGRWPRAAPPSTEEHVRVLKNFARRVVLAYDADAAGQAAAERFYEWEQQLRGRHRGGRPARRAPTRATWPAAIPTALRAAVEEAQPFLAFRLDRVLGGADLRIAGGPGAGGRGGHGVDRASTPASSCATST